MNLEKSNRLFILVIAAGLLLVCTTVFLQGQSIMKMEKSLSKIAANLGAEYGPPPNIEQNDCVWSGGEYKNGACICGTGYSLEQGQCVDEFGLQGGKTGAEVKARQEQLMNENKTKEYDFFCQSMSKEKTVRMMVDPIIARAGWDTSVDQERICYPVGDTDIKRAIVIATRGCDGSPNCDVGVLFVDLATSYMEAVAEEESGEIVGPAIISDIIRWTPTDVTYRLVTSIGEGYQCNDQTVKDSLTFEEKVATIHSSRVVVTRNCFYATCADMREGLISCR